MFNYFRITMIKVGVLICLITLTSQLVYSKVITVNITSDNNSHKCCTEEGCMCASLSIALQYISSNTTINITSSSVMLEKSVKLGSGRTSGSGNLTNITITGSNVTIMCNNSGSVYCESCDNVVIDGITWDRCGNPNVTHDAGVMFVGSTDISLVNCTFQHSQVSSVVFAAGLSTNVNVHHCKFLSSRVPQFAPQHCSCYDVLRIDCYSLPNYPVLVHLNISESHFYDNKCSCNGYPAAYLLNVEGSNLYSNEWHVIITKTTFRSNTFNVIGVDMSGYLSIELRELNINNNFRGSLLEIYNHNLLEDMNRSIAGNIRTSVLLETKELDKTKILIINSNFTNNYYGRFISLMPATSIVQIILVDVEISHNIMTSSVTLAISRSSTHTTNNHQPEVNFTRVKVMSNKCLGDNGGTVNIHFDASYQDKSVLIKECEFFNNTSTYSDHGTALYISYNNDYSNEHPSISIKNSKFHCNHGRYSVIYLNNMYLVVHSSNFTHNTASSIYLVNSNLECTGTVIFANNTADNGGAVYMAQGSQFIFRRTNVQFINNLVTKYGGAIQIDLPYNCPTNLFSVINFNDYMVSFVNNAAGISGNSLYFYAPTHCITEKYIDDADSILYIPCKFNYSQLVNGKMMATPCDLDYKLLNGTGVPIVTSPHELKLYFPFNEGYNLSSTSDRNIYFIKNNVLGYPVKFTGNVFDYFGKPAQPTQFIVQCVNCSSSIVLPKTLLLVDNISSLSVTFTGAYTENIININVTFTSAVNSIKEITATLVVELIPCIDHPGYTYSTAHKACVCYHHNVDCHDSYNEIKRGYWFGRVSNTATTAPCHHYCKFTGRTETRQGYFELPDTIDGQCNNHRVGRACGECSSGYTLSYDSTNCISVDQCSAGWTVLVIALTCLYWIAIVTGVFGLMYFKFQISLGYLNGLIYYYSIIRILLDNNTNLSDSVFQFSSVISSFAQLTPQFLGKLCFVEDLSGIDQLFIHYSHVVGVSLLLLLIVVAAKWSARVTLFISRCIIRVICLLILLSYTSIVSTSLQLLQPLRFTDVDKGFTYSSPSIQYFHGRHAVYGVVAIICELVVGIGLPLLLLLQPFLSRKINFIRIKPLLDQFQGCYKDKYRWYAAYYLICRQVVILIAFSIYSDYNDTAFYLLAACVIIAGIHTWIQPYKSALLNRLDGVMLLLMILANSYVYINNNSLTTVLEIITIVLPLILFIVTFVRKDIDSCRKKRRHYGYVNINNTDTNDGVAAEENIIRYVSLIYNNYDLQFCVYIVFSF